MAKHQDDSATDVRMPLIRSRLEGRVAQPLEADPAWLMARADEASVSPQKRAAVATILRDSVHGPEVLLIRRAEHPHDPWSGHMAFPGGREDPRDTDLLDTAVRETREEIALDLREGARLLGRLDDLPAVARGRRTGMVIAPFVFELLRDTPFVPNHEVAEALWAPIVPLMRGDRLTSMPYVFEGRSIELPAHDIDGRIVWGLTFRMLDSLFSLLR